MSSATAAFENRRSVQGSTNGEHHDGREGQDDRAYLADKLLASEHADVRETVAWMVEQLMDAEVAAQIGAEHSDRTPERLTHRNGYRPRSWDTRVGEVELAIPGCVQAATSRRSWTRRRAEQTLVAVVQEAYVNGVSTRKVDRLVEQLGVAGDGQGPGLPAVSNPRPLADTIVR